MSKKVLLWVVVVVILAGLVSGSVILAQRLKTTLPEKDKTEIASLVENFGKALVKVDKIAPEEEIAKSINTYYTPFLTPGLLSEWIFNPEKALGRIGASSLPDSLEILSIERIDIPQKNKVQQKNLGVTIGFGQDENEEATAKVKGYLTFAKSNANEIDKKVPIVLIVKQDCHSHKWLIDKVYINKFAFYDGKLLIKTLKDAFKGMYYIGGRCDPFAEREVSFTAGTNPIEGAIVDMGTGGAYTEYYTVCMDKNGKLEVVNFKDKNGNIAPLFFEEGASVKHEARLNLDEENSNLVVYQSIVNRDDSGKVSGFEVEAYLWNNETHMFEYNKTLSEKFKKELEEKYAPEIVSLSSLKFKEIKADFPAISTIAIYGNEIAFSSGKDKNRINEASGTINHIEVFDINKSKFTNSATLNKSWANIDKIKMNDKWILFRVVENGFSAQTECFAINRKTNEIKPVVTTEFHGKYVSVKDIALVGDNAFVLIDYYEMKGTPEQTFSSGKKEGESVANIYLPDGSSDNPFNSKGAGIDYSVTSSKIGLNSSKSETYNSSNYTVITNFQSTNDCIAVTSDVNNNKKQPQGVKFGNSFSAFVRPSNNYMFFGSIVRNHFIIAQDKNIIFEYRGKIAKAPFESLDGKKMKVNFLPYSTYINPYLTDTVASDDYIVSLYNDDKNVTDTYSNGKSYTSSLKIIAVYNLKTYKTKIIKGVYAAEVRVDGDILYFVNHKEDDTPDSIIYLNLKENNF